MQSRVSKPMQGGPGAGSNGEGAGVSTAGLSSLGARSEPLIVELCRSMPVRYFAEERYKGPAPAHLGRHVLGLP